MACGKVTAKFTRSDNQLNSFLRSPRSQSSPVLRSPLNLAYRTLVQLSVLSTADPEAREEGEVDRRRG